MFANFHFVVMSDFSLNYFWYQCHCSIVTIDWHLSLATVAKDCQCPGVQAVYRQRHKPARHCTKSVKSKWSWPLRPSLWNVVGVFTGFFFCAIAYLFKCKYLLIFTRDNRFSLKLGFCFSFLLFLYNDFIIKLFVIKVNLSLFLKTFSFYPQT